MKKKIENMSKNQLEMKNAISEMKNTLGGIKSRLDGAKDQINKLENKVEQNTQSVQQDEKRFKKNKYNLRELWDNMKCNNICIIGILKREEREQEIENLFEKIITKNCHKLVKKKHTSIRITESPNQNQPQEDHSKTHRS